MPDSPLLLPDSLSADFVVGSLRKLQTQAARGDLRLDCAKLKRLDSLGLAFLSNLQSEAEASGHSLILQNFPLHLRRNLEQTSIPHPAPPEAVPGPSLLEKMGDATLGALSELRDVALLFSESLFFSTWGLRRSKTLLRGDTVTQMSRLGSTALPIVLLLSVLIGFTLALQSASELQKYGATIFLADGMGMSMLTEIGPVLTAVILAGRSGSAITAEIATMVVQEEVAALKSMSINPIHFLVLPRFWALSLTQPLLTVAACLAGITSGLLVGVLFYHLSVSSFLGELRLTLPLSYVWQAFVKSLTYAWLIVFIAVTKGLRVQGGADAVGRATTQCVVTCIFAIILADALYSFVFYL